MKRTLKKKMKKSEKKTCSLRIFKSRLKRNAGTMFFPRLRDHGEFHWILMTPPVIHVVFNSRKRPKPNYSSREDEREKEEGGRERGRARNLLETFIIFFYAIYYTQNETEVLMFSIKIRACKLLNKYSY